MALDSCLFAVRLADGVELAVIDRRLEALSRFYAPFGVVHVQRRYEPLLALLVGQLGFGDRGAVADGPFVWGGPVPPGLSTVAEVLRADSNRLRALDSVAAMAAAAPDRARVIAGAGGVTALYAASGDGAEAWATHAVAAAWLARESVSIDPLAVSELVAAEFVGDGRTLLDGVEALPPATVIDITPDAVRRRSYWSAGERWSRLPAERAYAVAEEALLASLSRCAQQGVVALGLTAGLDSRVAAVALAERGVTFRSFTWGQAGAGEVEGARAVANKLGIEHRVEPGTTLDDAATLERIDTDVRWTEGAIPVSFDVPTWPASTDALVTGGGGEVGRAFYYRERVHAYADPDPVVLSRGFHFQYRIAGAHSEARENLKRRLSGWIDQAIELGYRGWDALDVLYAEQRVRRWGRGMIPRLAADVVPAFATPTVMRALASQHPLTKASDGFHRQYLECRRPALSTAPRRPRRQAGALRSALRRRLAPAARPVAVQLRRLRTEPAQPWPLAHTWSEHEGFRRWLADGVLGSALLEEALGPRWLSETRRGLIANERASTEIALLAAAPVALAAALDDLTRR